MTEDEATTKWCPMARVMNKTGAGGGNRWDLATTELYGAPRPSGCACFASACMMWRWAEKTEPVVLNNGYCGLAGEP